MQNLTALLAPTIMQEQRLLPPDLPHGPKGIIVGYDVSFGHGVTIYQHSTVTHGGKTIIGNNVLIGAGAVVLPSCHIGDNAKVGANAVVTEEIPQNATVVPQKSRIILREQPNR